ncbi:hypothetical protein SJI19_19815 [Acerihabitans sp. TG2]|uniref:hypothetical protein n=1 Tax=Acerihabitans sp. TG2 TaxID=3096008 RepID=UPI002B23C675|nr:hypothetical protein [Acerihabitans sp. TG2]MEA9392753.1 hypothetical protein [Acerihabitans sp. TG2]
MPFNPLGGKTRRHISQPFADVIPDEPQLMTAVLAVISVLRQADVLMQKSRRQGGVLAPPAGIFQRLFQLLDILRLPLKPSEVGQ